MILFEALLGKRKASIIVTHLQQIMIIKILVGLSAILEVLQHLIIAF